MFEATSIALQFVTSIRRLVEIIGEHDRNLADQLRRASTSTVLNTAESGRRRGHDQRNRARTAAAECDEAARCASAPRGAASGRAASGLRALRRVARSRQPLRSGDRG